MAEEAARAEAVPAEAIAAERPTERRFMRIRTIKTEERILPRQAPAAETAGISLEKMICHRFPM